MLYHSRSRLFAMYLSFGRTGMSERQFAYFGFNDNGGDGGAVGE